MSDDTKIKYKKQDSDKIKKNKEENKIPFYKTRWFFILVSSIILLLGIYTFIVYWGSKNLKYNLDFWFTLFVILILGVGFIFFRYTLSRSMEYMKKYQQIFDEANQRLESLYPTNDTPLEKKHKEIDDKVKEWSKFCHNLIMNGEYGNVESPEDTEKFNNIEDQVYRLSETYTKHKGLLELAYYMAKNTNNTNINKYKELLINIDKEELEKLQTPETILKFQQKQLSQIYKDKANELTQSNKKFICYFLIISGGYMLLLALLFFIHDLPSNEELFAFIITKTTLTITFSLLVFWVARFFNRRIHENVHLIEEYQHRALLLETFDILTQSVNTNEHKKEILDKVILTLLKNPTYCLSRKKTDKVPTEIIETPKSFNLNK